MKKKVLFPAIFLILLLCLFWHSKTVANVSVKDINIPCQYGSIKEIFETQNITPEARRTIIHIQDAHCNYGAQKNMAQLLEYLIKEYNLRLIMVEGGSGNVNLSFLRAYSDKKAREEIADKYLKMGEISGEEYLDIVSDYNIELYGIEDEALYAAHLAAFEQIDSLREKGLKYLEGLSHTVTDLKSFIYSEELKELEEKGNDYEHQEIPLAQYCQYLKEISYKKNFALKGYPHLVAFCEVSRLEKEIDFQQAESERNIFIKDLAGLIDGVKVKELINKSQEFKSGKMTAQQYYSFLEDTAAGKLDLKRNYPHLDAYIDYITLSKDINATDLLKELNTIAEKIKEVCFTDSQQRRLNEISKSIQILSKILNLELTPEDYEYFQANQPQFLTASWVDFLTQNCHKYNLTMQPFSSSIIDENLKPLDDFYQLGALREKAFIKNLLYKMDELGQNLAVLITGGFHTPGITQMLKDKGYSYVVVSPLIKNKTDSSTYFSVLRGNSRKWLEEASK